MFGDIFGGGGRRSGTPRGTARPRKADVETTATIGFTDALDGVTIACG